VHYGFFAAMPKVEVGSQSTFSISFSVNIAAADQNICTKFGVKVSNGVSEDAQ